MAHRMWLDYMHDNKEAIIKKVGDGEYQKMLKDGMVNVKAGTSLILDEHDPTKIKLHDIGGKISHLDGHHEVPTAEVAVHSVETGNVAEVTATENWPAENAIIADDVRVDGNAKMAEAIATYRSDEHQYFIDRIAEDQNFLEKFGKNVTAIRKDICGGNIKTFSKIRNLNFFKNQTDILDKLPKAGRKVTQELLKWIPIDKAETFDQWARRVVRVSMEK